ncbi:MAG TPA: acetyl-CoA carboxylase biotin carboxyl carrier protein [Pyrinomonadaceae bacterium]|nr:acetyl-CoA carboxylase biotin carboxyl carrier protein [Pyrinomonadaceae bacterium]
MSDQDQPQTQAQEHPQRETSRGGGERGEQGGGRRGGRGRRRPQQHERPHGQPPQQRSEESALNLSELRELADLFTAHGLTDFEYENADIRIRLSRNPSPAYQNPLAAPAPNIAPPPPRPGDAGAPAASQQPPTAAETAAAESPAPDLHIITSPIVGTFYRSPSPEADPFVRVGSHVDADTVVCIIEAMKLMNEVQAEVSGTVEKIYVENGQPVEYGQPLFGVKK